MGGGASKSSGATNTQGTKTSEKDVSLTELAGGEFAINNKVELGRGAYSVVKLGLQISTHVEVAVKCIDGKKMKLRDRKALDQEIGILRDLDHPNIVRMLADLKDDDQYYIVMEKVEGGELFDRIVALEAYSEEQARATAVVLLDALRYLHEKNIAHRDLKPENLLLESTSTDSNVKIADFGFATKVTGASCLTEMCGTPGYVAPEVIKMGKPGVGTPYGLACDMWSVGVIIFVLLGGYPPFDHDNQKVLFDLISTATYEFHEDYWSEISAPAKDLITKLLQIDPDKRMTADQALRHPWLMLSESELQSRDLQKNQAAMKRWNHKRKLKKVMNAVVAANRMSMLLGGLKKAAAIEAEAEATEATSVDTATEGRSESPSNEFV